jgi:hypothetical protein
MRNTRSSLKRRRRPDPMQAYDNLPPALRSWLSTAVLPWSPQSALRIWRRASRKGGADHAIARLNEVEAGMLAKDRECSWRNTA